MILGSIGAPQDNHRQYITDGVNLNGRTPVNPRLMYPIQYMDPEYHHTTYKHLTVSLNHFKE